MGTEIALIFGSVAYESWAFLEPLKGRVTVICADGGTICAAAAGFSPDVYIGDSDSGGVAPEGVDQVLLPVEKDLTDLQAAYEYAKAHGFSRIVATACTGGRQDHHLANLQLLETAWKDGVDLSIWDERNEIFYLCGGSCTIPHGEFRYFSIVPLDRELCGVTVKNAKYCLDHATVRRGDSLTVSNETVGSPAEISIDAGAAWIIRSDRLIEE